MIAMGSVPQYAVQAVLDTLKGEGARLQKKAVDSLYLYPYVGGDLTVKEALRGESSSSSSPDLAYPWEHYVVEESGGSRPGADADFLQFHSPVIPGCETLFVRQLLALVGAGGYERVVILDAKDRGLWHGAEAAFGGDRVLHWGNKTVAKLHLETALHPEARVEELPAVQDTCNLVHYLADTAGVDLDLEYYAVSVYDGWNGAAVSALLATSLGLNIDLDAMVGVAGLDSRPVEGMYS